MNALRAFSTENIDEESMEGATRGLLLRELRWRGVDTKELFNLLRLELYNGLFSRLDPMLFLLF